VGEQDDRLGRSGDLLSDEGADAVTTCLVEQDVASARVRSIRKSAPPTSGTRGGQPKGQPANRGRDQARHASLPAAEGIHQKQHHLVTGGGIRHDRRIGAISLSLLSQRLGNNGAGDRQAQRVKAVAGADQRLPIGRSGGDRSPGRPECLGQAGRRERGG